jgi:MFS family permease
MTDLRDTPRLRWAVGGLALAMLLSSLGTSIANVALPSLAQAFDAPFRHVQWVVLAYLIAMTVLVVGAGRLGDRIGHRRVLLAGVAAFTAASLLCATAPTLGLLVAARVAQGLAAAVLMALAMALVRATVPAQRTGSAMGLLGTTSAVGTALGPALGGVLLAGPGWRAVFAVLAPLGAVTFLLARRGLPPDEARDRPDRAAGRAAVDLPATGLLAAALAAYSLAVTVTDGATTVALLAVAAAAAGLFVRVQARTATPIVDPTVLRGPTGRDLVRGLAMNVLVATVIMATLVVGPFHLSRALGLDAATVGAVMAVGPLISALSGVPAGRIVDRFGAPAMVTAGLVVMTAGCVALSAFATGGVVAFVAATAMLTPGYQLFLAGNNTAVMTGAAAHRRGVVAGMLALSRNLGLITGAAVLGAVFATASAAPDLASAAAASVATGTRVTFAVAAALLAAAVMLAARQGRRT